MTNPIVRVSGLTYYYEGEEQPALRDVNLEVHPGEFILLIGSSGCGKSTLALSLNGIIPLVLGGRIKGRVYIDGTDTRYSSVHELSPRVGIVFQDPESQLCNLYVDEEVGFGPSNLLLPPAEVERRVDRALADVGQKDLRRRLIYELSGGQKQRVAIASVLAMEPDVLILDEPTANLDPMAATRMFDLVETISRETGVTVILIEHNVDRVMQRVDRLIVMAEGRIVGDEHPRSFMRERGRFVLDVLGLRIPQACEVGLRMEEKGLRLESFPLDGIEAAQALGSRSERIRVRENGSHLRRAPQRAEPVIDVRDLSFTYPNGTEALRDVSLRIDRGDVVAILGENGSGKTTLSSLLVGLNEPTSGGGVVCGLDIASSSVRELSNRIGYVFQYPEHQFVEDTVRDEIAFGLRAQKQPAAKIAERVTRALRLLDLEDVAHKHPLALSMGEKRRLSVATMLVLETDVLILDEPTTGQDRDSMDNLMRVMMDANRLGTTVVLITHDMDLVARYCNQVVVMEEGKVVFQGPVEELCRSPWVIKSGSLVLPEVCELAERLRRNAGIPIGDFLTVDAFVEAMEVS